MTCEPKLRQTCGGESVCLFESARVRLGKSPSFIGKVPGFDWESARVRLDSARIRLGKRP